MKTPSSGPRSDLKHPRAWAAGSLLLLALATGSARAQPFTLDWFTLDGSGGTSTGGPYALSGTIGQPEAGSMSGGPYTLEGGFWPGMLVEPSGSGPTLLIQQVGNDVVLSWSPATPGFMLEMTDDLGSGVWIPAPIGNPVTIPPTGSMRFYRLKH